MTKSTQIAGLIGPTMIALAITEWINLDMMLVAAGPGLGNLVYLNGTLLFVAGLSIVRAHNRWSGGWPIAVTLTGWLLLFFGLARNDSSCFRPAAGAGYCRSARAAGVHSHRWSVPDLQVFSTGRRSNTSGGLILICIPDRG